MTANRIRELREAKGLSQDELGGRVGTNKFKVSRIENGETRLDLDLAVKIARALDVTVADVLGVDNGQHGPGLSEDAVAYQPHDDEPLARLEDLERNRVLYQATSNSLDELGIQAGDVLLIDISADAVAKVKPLAIVIVQVYSQSELLSATTIVRQFVPPALLITNSRTENRPPVSMTATDAHIKGVVISHHRTMRNGLS